MSVRELCTQTRIAWQGEYLAESLLRFHGQYVALTNRESCRVLVTFHTLYHLLNLFYILQSSTRLWFKGGLIYLVMRPKEQPLLGESCLQIKQHILFFSFDPKEWNKVLL